MRSLLETSRLVPLSFTSIATLGLLMRIHYAGCLLAKRTCCLCPSLLDRWHVRCTAGLELAGDGEPGGHALRSLIGLCSHALNLPGWVCLLVGVSARLEGTTAELSASCPDPMAMCLSPPPVLLRIGLLGRIYRCVACLLCGEAFVDARSIEALGTCSALSALELI
jgi:hypothetical protein